MTKTDACARKRTGWIWAITIYTLMAAAMTLLSFSLIFSGKIHMTAAQQAYFNALTPIDYILTVITGLANVSGAIALFQMRRMAFYLFTTGLTLSILLTVWHIASKGWLQAMVGSRLGSIGGFVLSAVICIYSWRLIRRGVLT